MKKLDMYAVSTQVARYDALQKEKGKEGISVSDVLGMIEHTESWAREKEHGAGIADYVYDAFRCGYMAAIDEAAGR